MNALTLVPLKQPVDAEITIPGSKSYTIRALLLAALTPYPVRLLSPLFSDDTEAMIRCLQALGVRTDVGSDWIEVAGSIQDVPDAAVTLDADLSAASIRFLIALACVVPGTQTLHGKEGLNRRPVRDLVDALRQLGAEIEYLEREGYPPVRVKSGRLNSGVVRVSGSTSSQYTSALLMIAPAIAGEVTVEIEGELISRPYLEMTLSIMDDFGVQVRQEGSHRFVIPANQAYQATRYTVEADASSAAYFLALAALTRSRITLKNLNPKSAQADMRFLDILSRMGNRILRDNDCVTIEGRGVCPLEVDMRDCPDQAQTLAVLAAFADGVTRITGLQSLRVKETDRIAAVQQELAKMGIHTEARQDELIIHGGNPKPARIATYGDHRMAMSFAVAGTRMEGMSIQDPKVVSKTFPTFWDALREVGVQVETPPPSRMVLIGFMGAGKSLLGPELAKALGWRYVDMDAEVLALSGRESISALFELDGETRFRELELQVAQSLQTASETVVSAGGGVVTNGQTMRALQANSTVLWLQADLQTVLERIGDDKSRPLLNGNNVKALYEARLPLYAQYADLQLKTDGKTVAQILDETLQLLQVRGELKNFELGKVLS
jgi:3-phosphoshikimate 1-carboxyvinyltransferase